MTLRARPVRSRRQAAIVFALVLSFAATVPAQGPQLQRVMRGKLAHAQQLLAAVVTSDWERLQTETAALEALTRDPGWSVLQYPEYAAHSSAFVRALQDLNRVARLHDLEGTPDAYVAVTMQCVSCHRYIARSRIAR